MTENDLLDIKTTQSKRHIQKMVHMSTAFKKENDMPKLFLFREN